MPTDRDRAGYVTVITETIIDGVSKDNTLKKKEELEAVVNATAFLLTDFFNNIAKIAAAVEELSIKE